METQGLVSYFYMEDFISTRPAGTEGQGRVSLVDGYGEGERMKGERVSFVHSRVE